MIGRLACIVACALAFTLIGSANAYAVTRVFGDGPGDVWILSEDPNTRVPEREQGDILRTIFGHRRHQIIVRTKFAELNRVGRRIFIFTQLRTNTGKVSVVELIAGPRKGTDRWRGRVAFERRDGRAVECRITHDIDYAANVAVVRIPRGCIDDPRTVQAKFAVATFAGQRIFADNPINHGDTERLPRYTEPVRRG